MNWQQAVYAVIQFFGPFAALWAWFMVPWWTGMYLGAGIASAVAYTFMFPLENVHDRRETDRQPKGGDL